MSGLFSFAIEDYLLIDHTILFNAINHNIHHIFCVIVIEF